jgi:hypothetical protein
MSSTNTGIAPPLPFGLLARQEKEMAMVNKKII